MMNVIPGSIFKCSADVPRKLRDSRNCFRRIGATCPDLRDLPRICLGLPQLARYEESPPTYRWPFFTL